MIETVAMDQASRIIARWDGASDLISRERIVCGSWKKAVGKKIAAHARAVKLVRSTLVIEVEDDIWRRNLYSLKYQILRNLERAVGPELVDDLTIQVMPRRMEPARETAVNQELVLEPLDEADHIADPGLRRIYKAARRRETA
jgi:hypothetical protein